MVYSILQHKEIPINIDKNIFYVNDELSEFTTYTVYDATKNNTYIGDIKLQNIKNGVRVCYIKNQHPSLYKHFGQLADQIELEHCLNRGIENPYIKSVAAFGTHLLHFLRGKRFINEGINVYLDYLIKNTKKGEKITTEELGYQKMYMPINMINELKEKIKISPLLKGLK